MEKLKLNETPVRTSRNFLINNIKLENVAVKNISMDQNPMGSTENATLQAFMNQYAKLKNIVEKYNETITRDIADVQKAVEKIAETDAKLADEIAK